MTAPLVCIPITQPMLACAPGPGGIPSFPVLVTPKIDGIRALMVKGALLSRTLKPIPNVVLRTALESVLPDGCDGELMYGNTFQICTSAVMTREGGPQTGFTYYAFDRVCSPTDPYSERIAKLGHMLSSQGMQRSADKIEGVVKIVVLVPVLINSASALDVYERKMLAAGFEGVIARLPQGRYKFGRSTPNEGLMLKIKRFEDAEARVTGTDELVKEGNDSNESGSGSGLLGALVLTRPDGVTFRVGTGFTMAQRKNLWVTRQTLLGKWVKYKFFRIGSAVAPRFPTFLGFRDPRDM